MIVIRNVINFCFILIMYLCPARTSEYTREGKKQFPHNSLAQHFQAADSGESQGAQIQIASVFPWCMR